MKNTFLHFLALRPGVAPIEQALTATLISVTIMVATMAMGGGSEGFFKTIAAVPGILSAEM